MTAGDGRAASGLRVLADAIGADAARLSRIRGDRCEVVAATGGDCASAVALADTVESLVCAREQGLCVEDVGTGAWAEHPAAAGPWRAFVGAPVCGGDWVVVAVAREARTWDDGVVDVVRVAGTLIAQRAQMEATASEDSDELFHLVAHHLVGPARTVRSLGDGLLDSSAELGERDRIKLGAIIGAAARIEQTVAALTRLRRVGRGEVPARVDIGELVDGVIAERADALAAARASVVIGELGSADVREGALAAAIGELIDNAIAYRDPGRALAVRIERTAGDRYGLRVIDNGVGIDAAFRAKATEPLRTLHTKGREPGAGIGLAVAAKVAALHGGELWLEDGDGGGLAVCLALAPEY